MPSFSIDQQILRFLKNLSNEDTKYIDQLIVSAYVQFNQLNIVQNILLQDYLLGDSDANLSKFIKLLERKKFTFTIEHLIELFEFVISPSEKEVNGAVYTPNYIRDYIVDNVLNHFENEPLNNLIFADISCGCGGFFYTLALKIKEHTDITFAELYENNFIGIDIKEYSINRTKLLLTLLAIENGEDIEYFNFNLFCANSLNFNFTEIPLIRNNNGIDAIIGNPPYVGSSKIDEESKLLLDQWTVTRTGKMDLYIPFFQIAIEALSENGILGYITVNNFYRSLNGRGIREYFSLNQFPLKIIDFGSEQVFKKRSTYTCICFIEKRNNGNIDYIKSASEKICNINDDDFLVIDYASLDNFKGWILQNNTITANIEIIENTGISLGTLFDIKNGFATLKNDIYLFTPKRETENLYLFEKDGSEYWIEKEICRNAIKPNTLKKENNIEKQMEKLIFPYVEKTLTELFANTTQLNIINENVFQDKYPLAYHFLTQYKNILKGRDKGKREYPAWYAYGRSQALTIRGYKLLFPYIADKPYFVLSNIEDLLFYNGYALISDNWEELQVIQKVLKSSLFWYYIEHTSKPYGSDYYALAKNYIKNFGVYNFNKKQKKFILNCSSQTKIDKFLLDLYNIRI